MSHERQGLTCDLDLPLDLEPGDWQRDPNAMPPPAVARSDAPPGMRRKADRRQADPARATRPDGPDRRGKQPQRQSITTREQVEEALGSREGIITKKLGELLLGENLISAEQLERGLAVQHAHPKLHLGEILIRMGAIDNLTMRRVLARKLGIPCVNLRHFRFEPVDLKEVHREFMRKRMIVPLFRVDARMVVAVENPLDLALIQELAFFTKLKIEAVMATHDDLVDAMGLELFSASVQDKPAEPVGEPGGEPFSLAESGVGPSDNTVVRLANTIVMDAFEGAASDIHIESMRGNNPVRVRFRKDGVLYHHSDIAPEFREALVSRIKIMSRLDISEKRRAQDGKVNFERFGPARIELRVVTIPTVDGAEDVVLRILSAPRIVQPRQLGLAADVFDALEQLIHKPQGLLFVCGPTGSGKTTTLHALMSSLNTPDRKIWTVEDPIEITQEGLRQVQVQSKIDWTFAAVLRSFMRADPDVIMVGETRDVETARTVIEASLTGHLVMSTMHTNSAAESMIRLLDFGLDPFNFADALIGVLGQRLVRRLCPACSRAYPASDEELARLAREYCNGTELDAAAVLAQWRARHGGPAGAITLHAAVGCAECGGNGYKGRLGVHELLVATPAIKKLISARTNVAVLARTAMEQGMRTLRQDGIEKILQGQTDWQQVQII
jgi:type II secretory ATPase GspE/PulE/Tfp pilus assembly ATPase PilB-like protein